MDIAVPTAMSLRTVHDLLPPPQQQLLIEHDIQLQHDSTLDRVYYKSRIFRACVAALIVPACAVSDHVQA